MEDVVELEDYDIISGKRKRTFKSTKIQIANYWEDKVDECLLNFDWSEATEVCWNCGTLTHSAQKCHIIPHMLGGEDIPSNYVLLCNECHDLAPDVIDSDAMWNWIKSNRTVFGLYGTYKIEKALMEFERIHGYTFVSKAILIENALDKFEELLKEDNIGIHSGKIKITSYLYLLENFLKKNNILL